MLQGYYGRLASWFGWQKHTIARSIRWRLTGWYVLMLSCVLFLFSAGTYVAVYRLLAENFDEILTSQANLLVKAIAIDNNQLTFNNDTLRIGRINDEHLIRIYNAEGTLIFSDNPKETAPELAEVVPEALGGERHSMQISGRDGLMRVQTFPITKDGNVTGALQVGLSFEDVGDTMRALLKAMLVLAPGMLLLASGGGFFLANRALKPIDRITRAAQQISAENFNRRLDLRGPDDEVGRLARTFDAMIVRLQAAFEQQRRFVADASHELRSPLTAIIGQIDVAAERPREAESYRTTLLSVREQAQRLARLTNDLLFLARSETQPHTAPGEPIDLSQLLPAIIAQAEPLAQARAQTVIFEPRQPLVIHGNEDDLIRLFLNLLDNAIRYTPQGGTISIEAEPSDERALALASPHGPTRSIRVKVRDSGPGIALEHLPHLFERFFRVDRGRSRAQGGTGLGLAIAQTIAQAHGGQLMVESTPGQGSTFTAILPRAEQRAL